MKYSLVCLSILLSFFSHAQSDLIRNHKIDSLTTKLKADSTHIYRFKKLRPYLSIDNRNSFILKQPVNFRGFQLGIIYIEKHTMGFGFYRITQKSTHSIKVKDKNTQQLLNQNLTINYATVFYQYTLINKRFYQIDLPFETGLGRANVRIEDSLSGKTLRKELLSVLLLGAGLQLVLKPVKWAGISLMGGYRQVRDGDERLNFNGSYYSIGLWIDFRQIYRDIKYYGYVKRRYRKQVKAL